MTTYRAPVNPAPVVVPCEAAPELRPLVEAVRGRDAPAVSQLLHTLAAAGGDAASVAVAEIVHLPEVEAVVARWLADVPADPLATTLAAARELHLGRVARDSGDPQGSYDHHRAAEQRLLRVCAAHPRLHLAWSLRVETACGLGLQVSEVRRRQARLESIVPHHHRAQLVLLDRLHPRREGGSWKAAFAFARTAAAAAPLGSPSWALVVAAHLDCFGAVAAPVAAYFTPDVLAEITRAADESVWHPTFGRPPGRAAAHAAFAAVAALHGATPTVARHARALDFDARETWRRRWVGDTRLVDEVFDRLGGAR